MISAVLHASLMSLLSYIWMARPVATNNIKVQVRVGFRESIIFQERLAGTSSDKVEVCWTWAPRWPLAIGHLWRR